MTLGLEIIKFILEQDPDNLPIVQAWLDKWFWRGYRVLTLVAMMMDYMLPKRVMSWKEAWEIYFEQNGGALFADLARYGIKVPDCIAQCTVDKEHISHQAWATFYQYGGAAAFHTWMPSDEEMDWLSAKYPNTFDKYYRARFTYWREQAEQGKRFYSNTLPMLCQVCQIPMLFTEPGDPSKICYRESEYQGEKYRTRPRPSTPCWPISSAPMTTRTPAFGPSPRCSTPSTAAALTAQKARPAITCWASHPTRRGSACVSFTP